mgnify:CR=1 FL=1
MRSAEHRFTNRSLPAPCPRNRERSPSFAGSAFLSVSGKQGVVYRVWQVNRSKLLELSSHEDPSSRRLAGNAINQQQPFFHRSFSGFIRLRTDR